MMSKRMYVPLLLFLFSTGSYSQNRYYFSKFLSLPDQEITAQTGSLGFPVNMENIKAMGMGNAQIAGGMMFNAMMYNPAFLGTSKKSYEVFGLQVGMPPATYDAAFFLLDHMDEFDEAVSLTRVWDGVNAFNEAGASLTQQLDALNQIQEGLQFSIDLVSEVIGDTENPEKHGVTVLPSAAVQYGNWGFALYGFGQSGFLIQQSPTIDALLAVDIPSDLSHPVQAAKSVAQVLGILSTVVLGGGERFSNEVFPVAFHLSYVDIVGAVGYGRQFNKNWQAGANLKIVNRRMATERVAVVDYDEILSKAWDNLQSSVTGVTLDIGGLYQSGWGTRFGLSLQNVIPMGKIEQQIDFHFRIPRVYYDKEGGEFVTNAQGDTAMVSSYRQVTVHKPFALETPFVANVGIYHPITELWDVALDWIDIAEQDTRYDKTFDRLRIGMEYRFHTLKDRLIVALRSGMADTNLSLGLGLKIYGCVDLDGAYAYDRFVKTSAYYVQLTVGWE
jgi:hypothetical protein